MRRQAIVIDVITSDDARIVALFDPNALNLDETIAGQLVIGMADHQRYKAPPTCRLFRLRAGGAGRICPGGQERRRWQHRQEQDQTK